MKKRILLSILSLLFLPLMAQQARQWMGNLKPRLVVLTDIGNCNVEPDDMESAVRL